MNPSEIKILHIDSNHPILWSQLQEMGFTNHEDYLSTKEEIEEKIEDYHGIVIRSRFKIDENFIDRATNLKFIARVGAGLESIDCEYANKKNIALIAAPEGNKNAVGEHTLGMILSLFNKLNQADREIRSGHWNREKNRGHELDGKTVGIIGYGNMGKSFAKKLRGFDCEVMCFDILANMSNNDARQVSADEFFEKADVVSLHLPWTPETDRLVDAQFIQKFKKPFWLINTSRGKNVVTSDLAQALQSGKILGAALDVLEYEKLSFESLFDSENIPEAFTYLLKAENVLLTPHIAGWTFESHEKLATTIVEKIRNLFFGESQDRIEEKRVTGIGGFFFKAENPSELKDWYKKHLGLNTDDYGCTFWWKNSDGEDCSTQWSPFKSDTNYFSPSEKQFMQNFRVDNLEKLLQNLKQEGVQILDEMQVFDYGKFASILDLEGNKIELWEPVDKIFL